MQYLERKWMNNIQRLRIGQVSFVIVISMVMLYLMMAITSRSIMISDATLIKTGAILPASVYQNEIYRYFVAHLLPRGILDVFVILYFVLPIFSLLEIEFKKKYFILMILSMMGINGYLISLVSAGIYSGYFSLLFSCLGIMYVLARVSPLYKMIITQYSLIVIIAYLFAFISGSISQVITLSLSLMTGYILGIAFYYLKKKGK
jgi:hypothetical protein